MTFSQWLENRQKGKSLPEVEPQRYGYRNAKATIYRAVENGEQQFKDMDYVTLSYRWAREHAQHTAAVTEEPAQVLRARVPAANVYEAYNPGEFFYSGEPVPGKVVFRT